MTPANADLVEAKIGAGEGNRTLVISLEGGRSGPDNRSSGGALSLKPAQQKQTEATEAMERAQAHAAQLERIRRASWITHNLDALIQSGKGHEPLDLDRFGSFIPKSGWPENDSPDNYHFAGTPVNASDKEGEETTMHRVARKLGLEMWTNFG